MRTGRHRTNNGQRETDLTPRGLRRMLTQNRARAAITWSCGQTGCARWCRATRSHSWRRRMRLKCQRRAAGVGDKSSCDKAHRSAVGGATPRASARPAPVAPSACRSWASSRRRPRPSGGVAPVVRSRMGCPALVPEGLFHVVHDVLHRGPVASGPVKRRVHPSGVASGVLLALLDDRQEEAPLGGGGGLGGLGEGGAVARQSPGNAMRLVAGAAGLGRLERGVSSHGLQARKLAIRRRPARWLFSGWNCVPIIVSRPTIAVTSPPYSAQAIRSAGSLTCIW